MSVIRRFFPDYVNNKVMYAFGRVDSVYNFARSAKFNAHQVYPGLFVGDLRASMDKESLDNNGITHIVSVMNGSGRVWKDIKYSLCHINDDGWVDLSKFFDSSVGFIEQAINNGGKVLIHCKAGVSRSVTISLAYVMKKENISPSAALKIIKEQRKVANPKPEFMRLLQKYYDNGFIQNSKSLISAAGTDADASTTTEETSANKIKVD